MRLAGFSRSKSVARDLIRGANWRGSRRTVGVAVPASAILYEAVQFALAVAEESGGAFDPTVGSAMETRGFNREYRSGRPVRTAPARSSSATYRDVRLDPQRKTITLLRPLLLDLGAVAKGLAIDMAAHELRPFENFAINAGGDLYIGGHNPRGGPWSVGIRHPRLSERVVRFPLGFQLRRVHFGRLRAPVPRRKRSRGRRPSHPRSSHGPRGTFGARSRERDRGRAHRDAGGRAGHGGIRSWSRRRHCAARAPRRGWVYHFAGA